jgi:hypothetical protein
VDGSTYSTVSTAHGTVTWNPDGSFSYTPNAGFFGTDTFSYVATDGNGNQSNSTTVTIRVLLPQISLVNVGTDPVLLSNDSVSPSSNADADHLDEVQIAVDPDSVFESLPYNLAGWKLNLDAVDAGGEVEFWSSLGKATELNNSGTGDESWEFGSTIGSGDAPSDVFADVNAPGTDTLQLVLVAPSGTTPPSSPPVQTTTIAGQSATLDAATMDSSTTDFVDGDADAMVTGTLANGQQAYVPLSNESQVYNDEDHNGNLTLDASYTGAIPDDKFLLPVYVTAGAGAYNLVSSGNGITVWDTMDRTGQLSAANTITFVMSGTQTFYVEGDNVGKWSLGLSQVVGASSVLAGTLAINVFSFIGPQDVPSTSSYAYSVAGLPAATSIPWSVNSQGTLLAAPATSVGSAGIRWGSGGASGFGQLSYKVNNDYTWSYYVNVVAITVANTPGGSLSASATAGSFQTHAPTDINSHGVESVFIDSSSKATNQSENASATITIVGPNGFMIKGPLGNMIANPDGNWGVDQMVVGFVQGLGPGTTIIGNYGTLGRLESLVDFKTPLLDTSNVGAAWAVHENDLGLPVDKQLIENLPYTSGGTPQTISTYDKPAISIPAFFNQQTDDSGSVPLSSVTIVEKFELAIDAGIKDPSKPGVVGAVVGNAYSTLALASWSWTASGTIDPFFGYTAVAGAGVSVSGGWTQARPMTQTIPPNLQTANGVGRQGQWVTEFNTTG